ncbi:MAG: Gfo/Idh/MocA family oxidoreductase [Candidatus Omnitrophica bacterium]|nr:Gfo/Idh/MocA family oxidoreductase [Candidatus Omnitrophota bacterium]
MNKPNSNLDSGPSHLSRRVFVKRSALAATGTALAAHFPAIVTAHAAPDSVVRIGMVGVGGRGTGLLGILLSMKGIQVPAVCDIDTAAATRAQGMIANSGRPQPELYTRGDEDFQRLMDRADLAAVIIATPWEWHATMAVCGMKAGKYVGVEVPAAITIEECRDLVRTAELTRKPCMMLENWSFRRDNLAVLNMIRQGLFGEIVHCHCAHSHNCVYWYFDAKGNPRWSAEHLARHNADQYPTHSLGPVLSWMNINCGDRFDYLTSTATRSLGLNLQLAEKYGPDYPSARRRYAQGDIITSVVKTVKGNTIVINNDMQLPRPYDNRWEIQGTRGLYNEQRNAVYIQGVSPAYEQWEPFGPYQEKYDHAWWKALKAESGDAGHGGTDVLELEHFIRAVREATQTPVDVYDSVIMSAVIPLSLESIARGSYPVKCPDFTQGKWQTRKPAFAVET